MQERTTVLMNSTYTVTQMKTKYPDDLPAPSLSQESERPCFQAIQNLPGGSGDCVLLLVFFSLNVISFLHLASDFHTCRSYTWLSAQPVCCFVFGNSAFKSTGRRLCHFIHPTYSSSVLSNPRTITTLILMLASFEANTTIPLQRNYLENSYPMSIENTVVLL